MKNTACLPLTIAVLLAVLTPSLTNAQSTPTATVPTLTSAQEQLRKMADLTPAQIADEADAIKAAMNLRKSSEVAEKSDNSARTQLKRKFQRDMAAAPNEEAREQLLSEYLAISRMLAAGRELSRLEAKTITAGK